MSNFLLFQLSSSNDDNLKSVEQPGPVPDNFLPFQTALGLLDVDEERFTEMMDTFQIEPLIDVNGSKFIDRNILAIISRYKRERSQWD
jgi:hypothetical protein